MNRLSPRPGLAPAPRRREGSGDATLRVRRPPASIILFLAILLVVALWIGSGMVMRDAPVPVAPAAETRPLAIVAVRWSEAAPIERVLTLYGDVVPNQRVLVRAETSGRVIAVSAALGAAVAPGDELVQIAPGDRGARLRRAEAQLASARRELDNARQLVDRGAAPAVRLQTAEAEFATAQAEIEAIELEIERTTLRAPIDGVINRQIAEIGDVLAVGGEAVEIVDNNPLVAVVQIPQHATGRVRPGAEARVSLISGQAVQGRVRAVAAVADAETRTLRVEIDVPNPERQLPAGVSAEVVIPTDTVLAHLVSPAVATLNDQGELGVFAVDADDLVVFHPIELVRAEAEGVWVTGPPDRARLITARPGFVTPGQRVDAREPEAGQTAGAATGG